MNLLYVDNDIYIEGLQLALDFSPINDAELLAHLAEEVGGGAITDATNAGPIVITSAGHGLANGDEVVIAEVEGNLAANGVFSAANVTADTFELSGATGDGDYLSGGLWRRAVPGGTNLALAYVAGSQGRYRGVFPASLPLTALARYRLYVTSTNYGVAWQRVLTALRRG